MARGTRRRSSSYLLLLGEENGILFVHISEGGENNGSHGIDCKTKENDSLLREIKARVLLHICWEEMRRRCHQANYKRQEDPHVTRREVLWIVCVRHDVNEYLI